jgi:hypothetical protein
MGSAFFGVGAITSSSGAAFELHVVPPTESDAELSHTIDSFAQASDADLATGQQALQAQLREVLASSQKTVQMLVGSAVLVRSCLFPFCAPVFRRPAGQALRPRRALRCLSQPAPARCFVFAAEVCERCLACSCFLLFAACLRCTSSLHVFGACLRCPLRCVSSLLRVFAACLRCGCSLLLLCVRRPSIAVATHLGC